MIIGVSGTSPGPVGVALHPPAALPQARLHAVGDPVDPVGRPGAGVQVDQLLDAGEHLALPLAQRLKQAGGIGTRVHVGRSVRGAGRLRDDMPEVIFLAEADQAETARLRAALEAAGVAAELRATPEPVRGAMAGGAPAQPPAGLGPGVGVLSVFVGSRVDRPLLEACPDLRLVATRSTGYDHVDLAACAARGVAVANVPTYGENTVAEHTFALILALSRNVHKAWVRTQRGDFSIQGLQGFDLRRRTIGLVGVGHIGLHTAKIARGFGMTVLAADPRPQPLLAELIGFDYVELDELVARADIVSLHAPLTPATRHLVDRELLKRFKRGALLVNTARGGLIDTEALLWALDEGILAGAGLDVLEGEDC